MPGIKRTRSNALSRSSSRVAKRRRTSPYERKAVYPAPEIGNHNTLVASYPANSTGHVFHINWVPQGVSSHQRVGKKIRMKSLQMRGRWIAPSVIANDTYSVCYYMVVYDKRPTGVNPTVADIMQNTSETALTNTDNSGRFTILRRKDMAQPQRTNGLSQIREYLTNEYISLKNLPTVYKSTGTGSISDVEQGALYLVLGGNQASGAAASDWYGAMRMKYIDQ